MFWTSA